MIGAGGFTGTGAMGAVDSPMRLPGKRLTFPKKKKDRKTVVREAAHRVVDRLLNDEDSKAVGTGDGVGRHA